MQQTSSAAPCRRSPRFKTTTPLPNSSNTGCDPRPKKRKRSSIFASTSATTMNTDEPQLFAAAISADTAESVKKDIAPFLTKHIPQQYAPQGSKEQQETAEQNGGEKANTRFCYRHRPDLKCRRPADEPTMEQLQSVRATNANSSPGYICLFEVTTEYG